MGVKDLWRLLEPAGRPVNLEQLQGIVLAIDVSVWLHQAVHGCRDRAGQPLQSAHLALLFSRICKLLHYQIKPVFVFDGGTPALKQQTLAVRSRRRQTAGRKGLRAEEKQRSKYMQARILQEMTGDGSVVTPPRMTANQPDIFDLPPLPEDIFNKDRSPTLAAAKDSSLVEDVERVDVDSSEFAALPPELKHEILQERQELERHTYTDPDSLPPAATDFSNYQLARLMKRSQLSRQLEDVRKSLKETGNDVIGGQPGSFEVEANRIMSCDSAHYILVKGVDIEGSSSQDEQNDVIVGGDDVVGISSENGKKYTQPEMEEGRSDVIICKNDVMEVEAMGEKDARGTEIVSLSSPTAGGVESSSSSSSSEELVGSRDRECVAPLPEDKEEEEEPHSVDITTSAKIPATSTEPQISVKSPIIAKSSVNAKSTEATSGLPTELVGQVGDKDGEDDMLEEVDREVGEEVRGEVGEEVRGGVGEEVRGGVGDEVRGGVGEEVRGDVEEEVVRGEVGEVWEEGVLELPPSEAGSRLREEVAQLGREVERQKRAAVGVSSQVYREAQELLSLFGLPYVVSPMEAEAQCAYLDHTHQTHGSVTDDSDIFLFGGQRVYRHFFSQDHHPSSFSSEDIQSILGLTRSRLVCLAYLLGSDYTAGLDGVGMVNAMEVIGQFKGEGLDSLQKLKEWHTLVNAVPGLTLTSTLERKLRALNLPEDFPSRAVWQAYMSPEIDTSTEQFHWGTPDLDLIRKFMSGHVGWSQDRVDSVLLPVLKRANDRERRITSYFPALPASSSSPTISSRRLRNVVARITDRDKTPELSAVPKAKKARVICSSSSSEEGEQHEGYGGQKRGRGRGRMRGRGRGKIAMLEPPTTSSKLSASSSSSSDEG